MQKVLTIAVAALVLAAGMSGVLAQGKGKGGNSQNLQGNNTLPQWDKGERKGWNGQNVPPGFQAK